MLYFILKHNIMKTKLKIIIILSIVLIVLYFLTPFPLQPLFFLASCLVASFLIVLLEFLFND